MKIVHVVNFRQAANGPTAVVIPIIKEQIRNGYSVELWSTDIYSEECEKIVKQLGAEYKILNEQLITQIKPLSKETNQYIVHFHGVFSIKNILLGFKLYRFNIPYVISTHGQLNPDALKQSRKKKYIAMLLGINAFIKCSNSIQVLSEREKENVKVKFKDLKVYFIPNGIEIKKQRLVDSSNKSKIDKYNILFMGRIDIPHKGIDLLVQAIKRESKMLIKNNITFNFIGPYVSKKDEEYIKKEVFEYKELQSIINILGPKYGEEKEQLLQECDMFIHTSRYEGMPMAVLEAMAMGVPCFVTEGTNMGDILRECRGGIVVETSVEGICKGVHKLVKCKEGDILQMGINAQEYCYEHLKWNKIACQYDTLYHDS